MKRTQINERDIATGTDEIQKTFSLYFESLNSDKLENYKNMDNFLDKFCLKIVREDKQFKTEVVTTFPN